MNEAINYDWLVDDEIEIPEREGFVIDTPEKANWAVCKIKDARNRRDLFNIAAESKIARMNERIRENEERCENETAFLLSALSIYIDMVPAKKTKTQKSFILPDGKLKKKFASSVFKADEAKLTEYLKDDEEYIKTIKKPLWAEFKKILKAVDGNVVRTDTGEIVEGVVIEEKPESFDIE